MDQKNEVEQIDLWSELRDQAESELDQHRREMKEITLMLEQSQLEVNKLTQRNASITAHIQQVNAQFDSLPRADIRMAFESALDAQQRLFVMRGQVEKLQSDQTHLKKYVALLEKMLKAFEGGMSQTSSSHGPSAAAEMVEMMVQAQESERQRLSRQMHDGPAQALSNFILQTEIAMRLFDVDQVKAKEELSNLKMSATVTFRKVRDFIFELRPMMLDDLGITPTLRRYVDAFKEQTGMNVRLNISGTERRLESYQEVMVFRAVQELLNNAARHSQASQIKVQIDMGEGNIRVMVDDDGKGFDTGILSERGMGLKVIRDRAEMLGGEFDIKTTVGRGTQVSFQVPAVSAATESK